MWSHSVTCHPTQVNVPRLNPGMQAGTRFTYPGRMEGWVDLVGLIVPRPGVESATFRSQVRRRTAAPPRWPPDTSDYLVKLCLSKFSYLLTFLIGNLIGKQLQATFKNTSFRWLPSVRTFLFYCRLYVICDSGRLVTTGWRWLILKTRVSVNSVSVSKVHVRHATSFFFFLLQSSFSSSFLLLKCYQVATICNLSLTHLILCSQRVHPLVPELFHDLP